jgi:hypothetical protein
MVEGLFACWPAVFVLTGFVWGALFSLVREFSRRLIFSAALFLITYKAMVNMLGHAGLQWDHWLAGSAILGVFGGCLVRPACARIIRQIRLKRE